MKNSNTNSIELDKETFLKASKRLTKEIKEYLSHLDIASLNKTNKDIFPLSVVQDLHSKAFGFRNTDATLKFFDKPRISTPISIEKKSVFLQDWSREDIVSIFKFLLSFDKKNDDMWSSRATVLMSLVINVVFHLKQSGLATFNTTTVRKYLNIDQLWSFYKELGNSNVELKEELREYLLSLPGAQLQILVPSASVREHHGYLIIQLLPILNLLKLIEDNDALIISPKWYRGVSNSDYTSNQRTFLYEELTPVGLNEIYNRFSPQDWDLRFLTPNNKFDLHPRFSKKGVTYEFKGFYLLPEIQGNISCDDSWLRDALYKQILAGVIGNKQFKDYYVSDLLLNSCKMTNQTKRNLYREFLYNLLNNYSSVVNLSQEFQDTIK